MLFDADFRDLFEVRGMRRRQHGRRHVNVEAADRVAFHYQGLDGIARRTVLRFDPAPAHIDTNRATFEIDLAPGARSMVCISAACEEEAEPAVAGNFFRGYRALRRARRTQTEDVATVDSSNGPFADALGSAKSDVYTLVTDTPYGLYPYAGIPWFSTIFGRDGIITAMLMLWADPRIAQGVLRTLAAMQATDFDPASDAQPGKILHEMRQGEMANLREVPFGRYYGSVDSTPLFLMLAGQYFDRTGDRDTNAGIWPNIEAALDWIDRYGDRDGDGFVEYARETSSGLANQGWKDSHDAVFHADGATAVGPIALCEVQAYVYAAKLAIARLAGVFGFAEQALRLADQAERLRREFEAKFWCDDIGTYALALDGAKQPCRVRTSNAGHALFAGIAATDRAHKVVARLMDPEGFSGWGIRTLAHDQPRFNPMSYHNGSVWPHDNALIALGMARYGLKAEVARVLEGLCTAANHQDGQRLPELFCGFIRKPHCGPTPYPVACAPQAWAAASLLGLLAASLGLELGNDRDEIRFRDPVMPSQLNDLVIRCLRLGDSRVDVRLHRYGSDVTAHVLSRDGSARVLVLK
jgi:glycogen debranching enzyme